MICSCHYSFGKTLTCELFLSLFTDITTCQGPRGEGVQGDWTIGNACCCEDINDRLAGTRGQFPTHSCRSTCACAVTTSGHSRVQMHAVDLHQLTAQSPPASGLLLTAGFAGCAAPCAGPRSRAGTPQRSHGVAGQLPPALSPTVLSVAQRQSEGSRSSTGSGDEHGMLKGQVPTSSIDTVPRDKMLQPSICADRA